MNKTWTIIITIVITIAIGAGGTYAFMNSKLEDETKNLQNQIDEFESQVDRLENQASTLQSSDSDSTTSTATVDETADWETCASDEYGFSFKYPSDWVVRDLTDTNSQIDGLVLFLGANPKAYAGDIFFGITISNRDVSDITAGIVANSNQAVIKTEIVKYGEATTVVATTNKTTEYEHKSYYFEKNGKTFIILGEDNDPDETTEIGDQIYETFEFTN